MIYNNVLARLRRTSASLIEASADLGARPLQTFRFVTLPMLSTALIAGALLAFALSFDEVIVTTFTAGAQNTLPLWIFGAIRTGQPAARGERGRRVRARAHDHPGRGLGAADRRRRRHEIVGRGRGLAHRLIPAPERHLPAFPARAAGFGRRA